MVSGRKTRPRYDDDVMKQPVRAQLIPTATSSWCFPRRVSTGWMTWDDLAEYADFNRDFLTAVQAAFDAGQSVDEAAATLTVSDRYANYGMEQARANIEAIYAELAAR